MLKILFLTLMLGNVASAQEQSLPTRLDLAEYELTFAKTDWSWDKLKKLNPSDLESFDQEQLDRLFAVLTSGPVPKIEGQNTVEFSGKILMAKGGPIDRMKGLYLKSGSGLIEGLETFGEHFWKGKRFNADTMVLQNKIQFGIGPAKVTSWRAPAKLYCGVSLLDSRRHSIIIDYLYNQQLTGVLDPATNRPYYGGGLVSNFLDQLVAKGDVIIFGKKFGTGLEIRDEVRMVRPGFYLGRAYLKGVFLLNFTLINEDLAKNPDVAFTDSCWSGEQQLAVNSPGRTPEFKPLTVNAFYSAK